MKRTPKPAKTATLPSREALLAFLSSDAAPARANKKDVAKAFGLTGEAKRALKQMIRALREDGALQGGSRALAPAGQMPRLIAARLTERAREGALIAVTEDLDGVPPTRVLVIEKRDKRKAVPVPRIGARVLLRTDRNDAASRGAPAYVGRIVKLLERAAPRMLAVYRSLSKGGGRATPVDKKLRMREIDVPKGLSEDAEDGDLVRIEVLRHGRSVASAARVVERLGSVNSPKTVSLIAIAEHGIPDEFPESVVAEAAEVSPPGLDGPRGLARPAAGHDRSRRRAGPRRRRACRADDDPANPGGHRPHRRHRRRRRLRAARIGAGPGSAASAAIRSIFPTASCRCCPSGISNDLVLAAPARGSRRRSPCAWSSTPTGASGATAFIA